jgi:two-component system, chemotaxis family, protein-glutamate methylesterase/glutaminase
LAFYEGALEFGVCCRPQSFHDAKIIVMARDLIVIGASAGGLRAVGQIAHLLPATLSACVLVVLHISPASRGMLASVIARRSSLRVKQAEQGESLVSGQIYVAPPDFHLTVGDRGIELDQGPKVNRARPAIDPLFRSAAALYGQRVIGLILTGFLHDGTAGLAAIKQAGGVAIVQDPMDAEFPDMPGSALAGAPVDYCAPLSEIPALLACLASGSNVWRPSTDDPATCASFPTPECSGLDRTALAVLRAQDRKVDDSLSIAAEALEERAELLALMAENERAARSEYLAREYCEQGLKARENAARLRAMATLAPKFPN